METKIENERKFLVKKAVLSDLGNNNEVTQGYLSIDPPIRVRIVDFEDCFLTIKIKEKPGINLEFEWEIPLSVANHLMPFHKHHKARKIRYHIGRLEVDVFLGELAGLVLLEFEQEYSGEPFEMPKIFLVVEEVTGDPRFENHNLCQLDKIPEEWRCQDVPRSV
jgi:CYTH domain-containing protein